MSKRPAIRQFKYTFEWSRGKRDVCTVSVLAPRSGKVVEVLHCGIVVDGLTSREPVVRMVSAQLHVMQAMVREVARHRNEILEVEAKMKTAVVSIERIRNHPRTSLRAEDYLLEDDNV